MCMHAYHTCDYGQVNNLILRLIGIKVACFINIEQTIRIAISLVSNAFIECRVPFSILCLN